MKNNILNTFFTNHLVKCFPFFLIVFHFKSLTFLEKSVSESEKINQSFDPYGACIFAAVVFVGIMICHIYFGGNIPPDVPPSISADFLGESSKVLENIVFPIVSDNLITATTAAVLTLASAPELLEFSTLIVPNQTALAILHLEIDSYVFDPRTINSFINYCFKKTLEIYGSADALKEACTVCVTDLINSTANAHGPLFNYIYQLDSPVLFKYSLQDIFIAKGMAIFYHMERFLIIFSYKNELIPAFLFTLSNFTMDDLQKKFTHNNYIVPVYFKNLLLFDQIHFLPKRFF